MGAVATPQGPRGDRVTRGGWLRVLSGWWGTALVLALVTGVVLAAGIAVDNRSGDGSGGDGSGVAPVRLAGGGSAAAPAVGRPAPEFTATAVDGSQVSLAALRGKAVWLTFGATWCAACRAEAPDIQAAYEAAEGHDVVVVAVFISEDAATVRGFAERAGLTYRHVADPQTRIAAEYRVNGVPAHFFIDRTGVLRSIRVGTLTPERIDAALAEIQR